MKGKSFGSKTKPSKMSGDLFNLYLVNLKNWSNTSSMLKSANEALQGKNPKLIELEGVNIQYVDPDEFNGLYESAENFYQKNIKNSARRNPPVGESLDNIMGSYNRVKSHLEKRKGNTLFRHISSIIAIFSFVASLFFIYPNVTGNVIGGIIGSGEIRGIFLFVLGCVGTYISLKN